MTESTPEASEEFALKVKELLEAITGKPYTIEEKQRLEGHVWLVYLDVDKGKEMDRMLMNKGASWVEEDKDGTIQVYSDKFYDINDVASEDYGIHFRDVNVLQDRKDWEKYREKVPGLIAELEAADRTANETNEKYGTSIRLWSGLKPRLSTSFDAKGMSEEEKLQGIERHTRAMYETWGLWRKWAKSVGREIYMKTTTNRMGRDEFIEEVRSRLFDIARVNYDSGKKEQGTLWIRVGDTGNKDNISANRGVWFISETRDRIVMMSDNIDTINARNMEEYRQIQQRGRKKALQAVEGGFREMVISSELIKGVIEQIEEKFKVKMHLRKDRPIIETAFSIGKLKPYGKLYEIEEHAKALAEAWSQIKQACNV